MAPSSIMAQSASNTISSMFLRGYESEMTSSPVRMSCQTATVSQTKTAVVMGWGSCGAGCRFGRSHLVDNHVGGLEGARGRDAIFGGTMKEGARVKKTVCRGQRNFP